MMRLQLASALAPAAGKVVAAGALILTVTWGLRALYRLSGRAVR